jgi:uncharacterized protein DUF4397
MASPDAPRANLLIDGSQVATGLAFKNLLGYTAIDAGQHRVEAVTVSNSTSIFQENVNIVSGQNQTLLIAGPVSKTQAIALPDGASTIPAGEGNIRVVNAASTIASADVYIVNSGSSIAGSTPVASGMAYGKATDYQAVTIGNYQVLMTATGTTNIFLNTGPLALTQGQNETVVVTDGSTGGFDYMVLTDQ